MVESYEARSPGLEKCIVIPMGSEKPPYLRFWRPQKLLPWLPLPPSAWHSDPDLKVMTKLEHLKTVGSSCLGVHKGALV